MKTDPLVPAELQWRDDGLPFSPRYGDLYHPASDALRLPWEHAHMALAGRA